MSKGDGYRKNMTPFQKRIADKVRAHLKTRVKELPWGMPQSVSLWLGYTKGCLANWIGPKGSQPSIREICLIAVVTGTEPSYWVPTLAQLTRDEPDLAKETRLPLKVMARRGAPSDEQFLDQLVDRLAPMLAQRIEDDLTDPKNHAA